jgi:hypothetical protein
VEGGAGSRRHSVGRLLESHQNMNKGRAGEDMGSKEMDSCPLTEGQGQGGPLGLPCNSTYTQCSPFGQAAYAASLLDGGGHPPAGGWFVSPGGVEHHDWVYVCALLLFLGESGPWLVFLGGGGCFWVERNDVDIGGYPESK